MQTPSNRAVRRLEVWKEAFEDDRIDPVHRDNEKAAEVKASSEIASISDAPSEPGHSDWLVWGDEVDDDLDSDDEALRRTKRTRNVNAAAHGYSAGHNRRRKRQEFEVRC